MILLKVKEVADKFNIKATNMNKAQLIRAIQKAKGDIDCFGSDNAENCDQTTCLWRKDCIGAI